MSYKVLSQHETCCRMGSATHYIYDFKEVFGKKKGMLRVFITMPNHWEETPLTTYYNNNSSSNKCNYIYICNFGGRKDQHYYCNPIC